MRLAGLTDDVITVRLNENFRKVTVHVNSLLEKGRGGGVYVGGEEGGR